MGKHCSILDPGGVEEGRLPLAPKVKGKLKAGHWARRLFWDRSWLSCIPTWMGQGQSKSYLHTIATEMSYQMATWSMDRGGK